MYPMICNDAPELEVELNQLFLKSLISLVLGVAFKAVCQGSPPGREKPPKDSPIPVYVTFTPKICVYHLDAVYTITIQMSKHTLLRNSHVLPIKV